MKISNNNNNNNNDSNNNGFKFIVSSNFSLPKLN